MDLDLDRIANPLRLAHGSHKAGSGKGCAMNVISYINGDVEITDYPECSARPLARLVQIVNDRLAGDDGFLSPENAVIALDLGWRTVGTANVPDSVVNEWIAELLVSPEWGVIRYADECGAAAIRMVADLRRRAARGEEIDAAARAAARAAADAATHAAARAAADAATRAAARAAALVEFTGHAIDTWRQLAGLDDAPVDYAAIGSALTQMYAAHP